MQSTSVYAIGEVDSVTIMVGVVTSRTKGTADEILGGLWSLWSCDTVMD